MRDKLNGIEEKYLQISAMLEDPNVVSDQEKYKSLTKEYSRLTPIVEKFRELKSYEQNLAEAEELMNDSDAEIKKLAQEEYLEAKDRIDSCTLELRKLLLPTDPNDEKNVIVEIRGGAGGDEAALFANSLFRMYSMYAASHKFKVEVMSSSETGLGGLKEVVFTIEGKGAYSRLKYESGVHRVQRVPETEASGRIHTSTVTVAVLCEADDDINIEIKPEDLEVETMKSSGAGGQHINKTESAIRILHKPSGIVVECQEERSQFQNREKAMNLLKAKLYNIEKEKRDNELKNERRSQIGTGDRSERIRTYNFPQGRVTDHRIGLTIHSIEAFMNGDLDKMIDALGEADTAEKLKSGEGDFS